MSITLRWLFSLNNVSSVLTLHFPFSRPLLPLSPTLKNHISSLTFDVFIPTLHSVHGTNRKPTQWRLLRLVSPGAATGGVTPSFFSWKMGTCLVITVSSVLQCHPYLFSPEKLTTCFAHHLITVTFIHFTRVSPLPLEGITPHLFVPLRPHLSTILCKSSHIFSFGCHSLEVSPGEVRPPSDATEQTIITITVRCRLLHRRI